MVLGTEQIVRSRIYYFSQLGSIDNVKFCYVGHIISNDNNVLTQVQV